MSDIDSDTDSDNIESDNIENIDNEEEEEEPERCCDDGIKGSIWRFLSRDDPCVILARVCSLAALLLTCFSSELLGMCSLPAIVWLWSLGWCWCCFRHRRSTQIAFLLSRILAAACIVTYVCLAITYLLRGGYADVPRGDILFAGLVLWIATTACVICSACSSSCDKDDR